MAETFQCLWGNANQTQFSLFPINLKVAIGKNSSFAVLAQLGLLLPRAVPWTACPTSPRWSCRSGQQEYWLFLQQTDEGFDLPSFQLELSILNLSVAVKRIVLWISELLEAVWIIAVKSTPKSGVINSYIMYPTSLGSQDVTWKETQPLAIPVFVKTTVHLKGDVFWPRSVMVRAGLLLMCQFLHEIYRSIFLHLSSALHFLWCPSHQALGQSKNIAHVKLVGTILCFCVCRNLWLLCNNGCHVKRFPSSWE